MATVTTINDEGAFDSTIRTAINTNFTNVNAEVVAATAAIAAVNSGVLSGTVAYIKTDTGTKTLHAALTVDATVTITMICTTTFADGDGGQPTLALGQTSATTKFAATTAFASIAAGSTKTFGGTLTAGTALLATLVAGTGTTETGAYTLVWSIIR